MSNASFLIGALPETGTIVAIAPSAKAFMLKDGAWVDCPFKVNAGEFMLARKVDPSTVPPLPEDEIEQKRAKRKQEQQSQQLQCQSMLKQEKSSLESMSLTLNKNNLNKNRRKEPQQLLLLNPYPTPDRSNFKPTSPADIGWAEGFLSDGRPYRAECWSEDGITTIIVFLSTIGIEFASNIYLKTLLVNEGIITFLADKQFVSAKKYIDASSHELWSINIVIADDESEYVSDALKLLPYAKK